MAKKKVTKEPKAPKNAPKVKPTRLGALVIDASELAAFLVDVPPGGLKGKLRAHDGVDDVVTEIEGNQETWGATLGVEASDVSSFDETAEQLAQINNLLPAAKKLVELLEETRVMLEDARERVIRSVSDAIDGKRKQPAVYKGLQAAYEKTLVYRSEAAVKAAATRAKKNAAKTSAT